jgi:SAM-dependent methyltransferase
MKSRGYDASGIDYEPEVVRFVNEAHPGLDVTEGNVLSLQRDNDSVGTYMSVGVVEHFESGPEAALCEARRVLHPDGVALISVPYLNPIRRHHSMGSIPISPPVGMSFHQYYFDIVEFRDQLAASGLGLVAALPYAVESFVTRERPLARKLWRSRLAREKVKRPLRKWFADAPQAIRDRNGHMLMTMSHPI